MEAREDDDVEDDDADEVVVRGGVEAVERKSSWEDDEGEEDEAEESEVFVIEALEVFFGLRSCN